MARKLIVEIIGDSTKLVRSLNQSTVAANKFGAEVTGSAGRAEKSLSRLQRVAAGGFIGAAAFSAGAIALRRVFDAAAESQQVLGQTQVALEATGKSWEQYGEQIQDAVRQQSRLGFDDEALLRTFSLFVRQAGDVGEALRRNNIAMDVARARFIDLEQAALLVNKAALGQAGALRRIGIDARKGADGVELLALLEAQFGGAAEDASTKAVGATDRLRVSIENVQESLGSGLLPIVTEFAVALSDAADGATLLAEKLRALGDVRIPAINIPINFELPGTSVSVTDIGKEIAKQAGPFSFFFRAQALANLFKDAPEPDNRTAARLFEERVDSFIDGLEDARDRAVDKGNQRLKAFGQKGFTALKTNELGAQLQKQFDDLIESLDLRVDQATAVGRTGRALEILDQTEAAIRKRIAAQGRTNELLRQLFDVQQQRRQILQGLATERQRAQQERVDTVLEGLGLAVDRAALTQGSKDDLKALQNLASGLRAQIAKGRDVVRYQQELLGVVAEIAEVRDRIREEAQEKLQARQFRALGLTATGEEIIPGVENLRRQLSQLSDRLAESGQEIGSKLSGQLAGARRLLRGQFGKLTEESRERIRDLFRTIRGTFDEQANRGPLTKTSSLNVNRILDDLGLGRDMEKELRARLSSINTAGRQLAGDLRPTGQFRTGPISQKLDVTLVMDGDVVARNTIRRAEKTGRRNPRQKRGGI